MPVKITKKKKVPYSGIYAKEEALKYFGIIEGRMKYLSKASSGTGKAMWLDRESGELVLAAEKEEPKSKLAALLGE